MYLRSLLLRYFNSVAYYKYSLLCPTSPQLHKVHTRLLNWLFHMIDMFPLFSAITSTIVNYNLLLLFQLDI